MMKIPFNKPFFTGNEAKNMAEAAFAGTVAGNGLFTKKCHRFFEKKYGFQKVLLTTSCSDALEMAAILCNLQSGDEVIVPSFTFTSTANAFLLRGAKVVFADSSPESPNIDISKIEELITPRTRVIAVVHYSGVACDMDEVMRIANKHQLLVVEDAAHAFDSFYKDKPLGSIGHFGCFSFHETKNIHCGEGGMLAVNDKRFTTRAEIIWEKGTNRAAFYRGEVNKYGWADIGSSFLPSELNAAFLYAQLEEMKNIQKKRRLIWENYRKLLLPLAKKGCFRIPEVPDFGTNNGNMFYLITRNPEERDTLLKFLAKKGIHAVFHYLPLHSSVFYQDKHDGRPLPCCDNYATCIVRLPFYTELSQDEMEAVAAKIGEFYH